MDVKNLKPFFLSVVLILLSAGGLSAQPGFCIKGYATSIFDPLRACNQSYDFEEFVFVGKVLSADLKTTELKSHPAGFVKVKIAVEKPLKGKLGRTIELFLDRTCYQYLESGDRRIFTARRIIEEGFNGLVSYQWSTSVKDISKNDLAEIVKEIRSVAKGVKQPRIVGKLVEYDADSGFWGSYLSTKLGYNPKHSHPLSGIEITTVATATDENRNTLRRKTYKTKTNPDGSFQFKDLPVGIYELSVALPDHFDVNAYFYRTVRFGTLYKSSFEQFYGQKKYVTVGDGICSEDVRFNVRQNSSNDY